MALPRVAVSVDMLGQYGRDILAGVFNYVRAHEPWDFYGDPERTVAPIRRLEQWDGDGIIVQAHVPALAEACGRAACPVVNVSARMVQPPTPSVLPDNIAVGRLAAEHLLQRGFQSFGFCGFAGHGYSAQRHEGFRVALEAAGHRCQYHETDPPAQMDETDWAGQERDLTAWLHELPQPVAIMGCNDVRARQLTQLCNREGLRVPEAVAIVGADNDEMICEMSNPPLSSVEVAAERVGYEAAALLDRLMDGSDGTSDRRPSAVQRVAPVGVVTRTSSDIFAIDDRVVAGAVRFIRQHASEPIQVDEVAAQTTLSRRALERRFRAALGRTINQELTMARLDRARQLLAHTDLSAMEIADRCGFNYAQQLNAQFRRHVGITPMAYRKANRAR